MNGIKPVEELTFTDDFIFNKVMQNPKICKELLERLLKIKIKKIEYPELQKEIKPYYSQKGVRLDVYVKDSDRIFDIEIQTTIPDALSRRMRYYQSMIDIDALMKGENYRSLKESYVIFLCTKDPLKLGLPVYTFKPICLQDKNLTLEDGTTKILFNATAAQNEKDVAIRSILGYLLNGSSCDTFTKKLETLVAKFKENEKFRSEYMAGALWLSDARDEGFKEGVLSGIAQQKAEDAKQLQQQAVENSKLKERIKQLEAQLNK